MQKSMPLSSLPDRSMAILRYIVSIGFFFLASRKAMLIMDHGLSPYRVLIDAAGLPVIFSFYGIAAVFIELGVAIGVWEEKTFKPSIMLTFILTMLGVVISLAFLFLKLNSDCHCGLLGDNEWSLLIQKLGIIVVLMVLYRGHDRLFVTVTGR